MQILKNILSVFVSLLIIVVLYVLLIIGNISSFFSAESIERTVIDIDFVHEIEKIKNSSVTAGQKKEIADIIDTAYEEADRHGISSKLVDTIFNSPEIKGYLGKVAGTTTDYVINGKVADNVTNDDFNKVLDENMDKWVEQSGITISDSKKEVLLIRMKQASNGIVDNLFNIETVNQKVDSRTLEKIHFIFSDKVKVVLVSIILISLLALFILNCQRSRWLLYTGVSILITGLVTIATSFVTNDIMTMALNEYNLSFLINIFNEQFLHNVFITGLFATFVAAILLIIYYLVKVMKTKK